MAILTMLYDNMKNDSFIFSGQNNLKEQLFIFKEIK